MKRLLLLLSVVLFSSIARADFAVGRSPDITIQEVYFGKVGTQYRIEILSKENDLFQYNTTDSNEAKWMTSILLTAKVNSSSLCKFDIVSVVGPCCTYRQIYGISTVSIKY